ncbi:MAG: hypothetical protein V7666_07850 [Sulfitobacter sp.]|uniref:hypothetical protein n=1 Tax=Sulfitobacter sp. TaxID=1903071 RepID=UPI003002D1E9
MQNVQKGHRHDTLVKEARRIVELVDSQDELAASLSKFRDEHCSEPQSFPDGEVLTIAEWAWQLRLEGKIFKGRASSFRVERIALDALRGKPNGSDATSLYVTLVDKHGHQPAKKFALDFKAMRLAGLTDLTDPRLRNARRMLIDNGLLRQVGKHFAGRQRQTFSLVKPNLGASPANVTQLTSEPTKDAQGGKKKGEG